MTVDRGTDGRLYPLQTHLDAWKQRRPPNRRLARPHVLPDDIKPRFARLVRKALKGQFSPLDLNRELKGLDVPQQSALVRAMRDRCANLFVLENLPHPAP